MAKTEPSIQFPDIIYQWPYWEHSFLAFGWFGFNPGVNTGRNGFSYFNHSRKYHDGGYNGRFGRNAHRVPAKTGKFDPGMMANGLLAGLVAITAPSAFVNSIGSVAIGSIAGILVYYGYNFIDRKLKIDDPVGAIAVHGINGAWGVISVGIFADGSYGDGWNGVPGTVKGILYGDGSQLVAQLIGTATCFVFVFAAMWSWFKISNKFTPIRVKADDEIAGLDIPEMGVLGYVD